jgi:hypothetical protein
MRQDLAGRPARCGEQQRVAVGEDDECPSDRAVDRPLAGLDGADLTASALALLGAGMRASVFTYGFTSSAGPGRGSAKFRPGSRKSHASDFAADTADANRGLSCGRARPQLDSPKVLDLLRDARRSEDDPQSVGVDEFGQSLVPGAVEVPAGGGSSWPMRMSVSHCSYRSGDQPRSLTSRR